MSGKLLIRASVLLAALVCSTFLLAKEPEFYLHSGPILLSNITIIDGLGHDPKPARDVLVQDGRIARISVTGMMPKLPRDIWVLDGKGLTVLPGLMDTHTHIANIDYSRSRLSGEQLEDLEGMASYDVGFSYSSPSDNLVGMQRYLNANLYAGVTTILEFGGNQELSVRLRDEINAGERPGPTIFTSGFTIEAFSTSATGRMEPHSGRSRL
ncbi:MAG: amidohydrolase family protein [Gammaproteobacteria bacterium]|nr:amidohydrolase family protein [Gammaproteobacteria bacterium]